MSLIIPESLPLLRSVGELAELVQCPPGLLYRIANHSAEFYRVGTIPKRNGGVRTIEAPVPVLKLLQRRLLNRFLSHLDSHPAATAFEPGRSIREHARLHVRQPRVVGLDLRNFFPSLRIDRVYPLFRLAGCEPPVAALLAHLCCRRNHLPQGAPTSPKLSNLILYPVDEELAAWAAQHGLNYSRYADDLTFSGELPRALIPELIHHSAQAVGRLGLRLNRDKIRVQGSGRRQIVTGLVVNQQVNLPREQRRLLRLRLHYIAKFGWSDARWRFHGDLHNLLGTLNFAAGVTDDPCLAAGRELLRREAARGRPPKPGCG